VSAALGANTYFKREEMMETITQGQQYHANSPFKAVKYEYSTGAVYEGQMKGGFRDGKGTMTWPDGASYSGQWKEGFANG